MLMPDLPDPALYDPEPVATGGGADAADADADAEGSGYGAAADGGAGVAVAGLGMPSICRARTPSAAPLPTPATRQHAEGGGGGGGAPTGGLHHSFGLGALMPSALAAPTPRKGSLTRETMQDLLPQDADQPPPSRKSTSSASMASPMAASASASRAAAAAPPPQPPPLGDDVVSRWSGKATYGPLDELRLLPEEALARVVDFELRRPGYGAVRWLEPVDLRGGLLGQLASVVVFSEREVLVYPSGVAKPPPGEGLNRRCHVSMEGVWPRDRKTSEDLRDARSVQQFRAKLQSHADRLGATMLGYDGELGLWRFQVEHF
jgi:nuclear pore complex protein Nup98-Nup96